MAQTKTITTTLDRLPAGVGGSGMENGKLKKFPLPETVTRGMLFKDIILIAWPTLVELLLTQLTSMADQVMVGRLPGAEGIVGLSAVGLAAQPKFLLMTMIMSLNVGVTAVIARFRGQQDQTKVRQTFRQMLLLNLLVGLVFMGLGLAFSPQLIRIMSGSGISDDTYRAAVEYLNIQLYGLIPLTITFTITASLRGIGDSRIPLLYNTIANVVNLIMNYIMIYGKFGCPAMGVAGASWATVIGQTVAFLIAAGVVFSGKHYIHFEIRKLRQRDPNILRDVVNIGIPAMVEQLFMRLGVMIFTRAVAGLGDTLYATHQICMNVQGLTFMTGQAFAASATTLMGQSLGKRREDMASIYMQHTRAVGFAVSVILGILIAVFNKAVVGFYNSNPEVIAAGGGVMLLIAVSQPLQSMQFIVSGGLRGAGDTRYTAFVIMITTLGVRSVLAVLLVTILGWGLWGAWIALMMDQCIRTVLMVHRYNTGKWVSIWGNRVTRT